MRFETIVERDDESNIVWAEVRVTQHFDAGDNLFALWLERVREVVDEANYNPTDPVPDAFITRDHDPKTNIVRYLIEPPTPTPERPRP